MSDELGKLEEERDELRRELVGTQEMLAFVLMTVGEPVAVDKETLKAGLPLETQISIMDDQEANAFVFSLVMGGEAEVE